MQSPTPAEDQDKDHPDKVEFPAPKGFTPPMDSGDKDWDMVCSFRTKPDGKICMTKLGDTAMPGYGGESAKPQAQSESAPDYKNMAGNIVGDVSNGGY